MNRLNSAKRIQVVAALVDGVGINATTRMTNVSKPTVLKLLAELGGACATYQDRMIRNVRARRIQVDEIWQFVYSKQKNVPTDKQGVFGFGDVWTWVAIDADSKLVPSWRVGPRDAGTAYELMTDLASRLTHRVQLTTDAHRAYLDAVDDAFGSEVDYAVLQKLYGSLENETRYSPSKIIGVRSDVIRGDPDPRHISTSYVERQNLTMRMSMRRFTRLTNGFSKKIENHAAAVALHYMHYNFARVHKTLRVTPAMQAGLSAHVWSIGEIVQLLDADYARTAA